LQWSHVELMQDLAQWLKIPCGGTSIPRFVTVHASLGSAWEKSGVPQADVLSVRGSHTNFELCIYEVKVSRSDWTSEMRRGKWRQYLPFCNRLVFACPSGLVAKNDVPEGCGLMTRSEGGWHGVVAGRHRRLEQWDVHTMVGILLSQGNTGRGWKSAPEDRVHRVRSLRNAVEMGDFGKLTRHLGKRIGRLVRLGRAIERGDDVVARIEAIESNLRGLAKTLGVKAADVLGNGLLPRWPDWRLGQLLRELQATMPGIEEASDLLAATGQCPPPGVRSAGSCRSCRDNGHESWRRPDCWREYLLRDREKCPREEADV